MQDAADVVQALVADVAIALAGEHRAVAAPQRLLDLQARARLERHRLGQEGRALAVGMGDAAHDVLVDLHPIGAAHQAIGADRDGALAGRGIVVLLARIEPHGRQHGRHLGAQIGHVFDRRHDQRRARVRPMPAVADIVARARVVAAPRDRRGRTLRWWRRRSGRRRTRRTRPAGRPGCDRRRRSRRGGSRRARRPSAGSARSRDRWSARRRCRSGSGSAGR